MAAQVPSGFRHTSGCRWKAVFQRGPVGPALLLLSLGAVRETQARDPATPSLSAAPPPTPGRGKRRARTPPTYGQPTASSQTTMLRR